MHAAAQPSEAEAKKRNEERKRNRDRQQARPARSMRTGRTRQTMNTGLRSGARGAGEGRTRGQVRSRGRDEPVLLVRLWRPRCRGARRQADGLWRGQAFTFQCLRGRRPEALRPRFSIGCANTSSRRALWASGFKLVFDCHQDSITNQGKTLGSATQRDIVHGRALSGLASLLFAAPPQLKADRGGSPSAGSSRPTHRI